MSSLLMPHHATQACVKTQALQLLGSFPVLMRTSLASSIALMHPRAKYGDSHHHPRPRFSCAGAEQLPCNCGAARCRGTVNVRDAEQEAAVLTVPACQLEMLPSTRQQAL